MPKRDTEGVGHILNLGTRWKTAVYFTLQLLLLQGQKPKNISDRRPTKFHSNSGCGSKEKNPGST
jgi:hypothetical protein